MGTLTTYAERALLLKEYISRREARDKFSSPIDDYSVAHSFEESQAQQIDLTNQVHQLHRQLEQQIPHKYEFVNELLEHHETELARQFNLAFRVNHEAFNAMKTEERLMGRSDIPLRK